MPKINLKSLDIVVNAPKEICYSWDGEVENVYDHCTSLRQHYAELGLYGQKKDKYEDIEEERITLGDRVNGTISKFYRFQLHPSPRRVVVFLHAYVRKNLPKTKAIFVRGHEEAHALYMMGMANLLGKEVDKVCDSGSFLERAFEIANSIHDKPLIELIANYGGRHALVVANLSGSIKCTPAEIDELSREMFGAQGEKPRAEVYF